MAKKRVEIQFETSSTCTQHLIVRYKKSASTIWLQLDYNPIASPFYINYLDDGETYDLAIKTKCCDGQESDEVTTTFTA